MCYLLNKCNALHAHTHKVHKLGSAQTDTSHYAYYQNLIKNESAHSKISNLLVYAWHLLQQKRDSAQIPAWHDLQPKTCSPFQAVQQGHNFTKPGFPWSPDHLRLPNKPPGSGFGLGWGQASSLTWIAPRPAH